MKDQEITPLYCDRASFGKAELSFAGFSRCCLVKFRDLLEIARGLPVRPYALSLIGKYCRRKSLKRSPTLSRFKQRFTSLPLQISIHISLSADGICETHVACPPDSCHPTPIHGLRLSQNCSPSHIPACNRYQVFSSVGLFD